MTQPLCAETRVSRAVVAVGSASQAATSRKLRTSNGKFRAKAEAGRNHKSTIRKARVLRARAFLVGHNRIRVADSLGTVTSVAKWATRQQTVLRKEEHKP